MAPGAPGTFFIPHVGLRVAVERGPSEGARSASRRTASLLDHLLRATVHEHKPINDPSKLARSHTNWVAWLDPSLRTSNDHSFTVGVP
jgi:hypothetical protein